MRNLDAASDPQEQDRALIELLEAARDLDYRFVTITPESHRRVIERREEAKDLRDIFGWSLPFRESLMPPAMLDALARSGFLVRAGELWKSDLRISSIGDSLFLHSAYPTDDHHSVFLGPDTYRFVTLIESELPRLSHVRRLVDIGAGAGVGGIVAGRLLGAARVVLSDINREALRLARINAAFAGVAVETVVGPGVDCVEGEIDLVLANPPFVMDEAGRAYRDGGDMHGAGLSLEWTLAAARRVAPGGTIILYTGSPIVAGEDGLRTELESRLPALGCSLAYREIDPDIFGELLSEPRYREVERIAAVAAVVARQPAGG